jgi:hypothetical protein
VSRRRLAASAALLLALAPGVVRAQAPDSTVVAPPAPPVAPAAVAGDSQRGAPVALVPELAAHPYRLEPGVRPFRQRLSVSPGYGYLGTERLFALRATYNPQAWLGYEASLGHNPGQSVHAVLHTFSAIVRRPLPWRLQPYGALGYGMFIVFPGQALKAKPVTKNSLAVGGGIDFFIRGDLAIRADLRHATMFGKQRDRDGTVTYGYSQGTIGLAFYRTVRP